MQKRLIKNHKYFPNDHFKYVAGFTIVELIVSIAIMAIVSGVIFWNGRKFNDRIEVNSAAEEVSLTIRQAQNYGSSVRESASGSGTFTYGYGITFNTTYTNPTYLIVFVDQNGDKKYNSSPTDESVDKIYLRNGVSIQNICLWNGSTCVSANLQSIQATFIRPNLDATIKGYNSSGNEVGGPWTEGRVTLQSRQGATKVVIINNTGQVSVQ